jgi:hypothetical protein
MAQKTVDPLDWRSPIVDKDGRPTVEFQRKWAQQHGVNEDVPSDATSLSKVLDYLGTNIGAFVIRGATLWGLLEPSADGKILRDRGVGATPIWDTLSNVIDKNVGTEHGALITRGAAAWELFGPGATAGYLLSSQGAGADLHWIAPIAAANPTVIASDTAVNGTATTFMRSDAAPAVQKADATHYGLVKPDNTTITVNGSGLLVASGTSYTLPTATTSVLGGVKVDGTTITIASGVISSASGYTLPTASTSVLGGVKVDGTTITIASGVISSASGYTLPTASTSVIGGVKVDGTTITIASGVISASGGGSGNTYGLGLPLVTGESSGVAALIADTFGRTIGALDGEASFTRLFPHDTFANRPASIAAATGGIGGFLATNTGTFYVWTGTTYVPIN